MPNPNTPEVRSLIKALRAQEEAISELAASNERQADTIAGVVLVLRALIDLVLSEEQRQALETHLTIGAGGDAQRTRRMIVDTLLD